MQQDNTLTFPNAGAMALFHATQVVNADVKLAVTDNRQLNWTQGGYISSHNGRPTPTGYKIIACRSAWTLAYDIANQLGGGLADVETTKFANGELRIKIKETVRGFDIFLVATGFSTSDFSINDAVMEIYLMAKTLKRSDAGNITLLLPNYPYARQDKKDDGRAAISARDVADMFALAGINRVVCMDLHNPCIQGYFNIPCDNLYGSIVLKPFLEENIFGGRRQDFIFVAPDEGGYKRTIKYAELCGMDFVSMQKKRDYTTENKVSKTIIHGGAEKLIAKIAIIVDDMCDTGGTVDAAAAELIKNGARGVIVCVTHGLLSGKGVATIESSRNIDQFICSDSVPQEEHKKAIGSKMKVFTVAPIYAAVVRRLISGQSLSVLFD